MAARWKPPAASRKALPWLAPQGDEAFWVVSGDIFMPGFEFDAGAAPRPSPPAPTWACCGWCPTPASTAAATSISTSGRLRRGPPAAAHAWTYANVALLRPALVASLPLGNARALGPLLFDAAAADRLAGRVLPARGTTWARPRSWQR